MPEPVPLPEHLTAAITDHPVLAATLALAVPLHLHDLRNLPHDRLCEIAAHCATVVGSQGDALQFGGRGCKDAFNALARGLACAALVAWGGITVTGLHWCGNPSCPGPDAPHDLPDGATATGAVPRPRPVVTITPVGSLL